MPHAAGVLVRSLRWLAFGLVALGALAAVALAAAVLINARDEVLSPAARALLTPPANPYSPAENIYLALQGFDAPPAESVIAVGEARVAQYDRSLEPKEPQRLGFQGDISFIRPLESSVWDAAPEHEAQIATLLADNHELMERYLDLLLLHGYYETARPSALPPAAAAPNEVRRLFLAQLTLQMRAPHRFERQLALAELESDIQLWHRVLIGEGTLRWKMLAIAGLQADYLLLADLIADPEVQLAPGGDYGAALVPLFDAVDFELGRAFAAEFRIQVATLRAADARTDPQASGWSELLAGRAADYFLKPNATINLLARDTLRWMAAAVDPAAFHDVSLALPRRGGPARLLPGYNPLGTAIVSELTHPYRYYPPRAWDQAALQRLVRLGYEIRQQRVAARAIPAFLTAHPQWSTHPANGTPFRWDAQASELQLQPVAQHPPAWRFGIRIWPGRPALAPAATAR